MRRLEVGSSKLPWGRASLKESGTSSEWDEYVHDLHQMRLKHVRADVKEHMKTPRSLIIHQKMFPTKNAGALQRSSQQEERYLEMSEYGFFEKYRGVEERKLQHEKVFEGSIA